jgi:hypothetical protein
MIGRGARGLDDVAARGVVLHAHVGDDHLIFAELELGAGFARAGGGVDLEVVQLQDGLHGQQNGYFIIDEQNATLSHGNLLGPDPARTAVLRGRRVLHVGPLYGPKAQTTANPCYGRSLSLAVQARRATAGERRNWREARIRVG